MTNKIYQNKERNTCVKRVMIKLEFISFHQTVATGAIHSLRKSAESVCTA